MPAAVRHWARVQPDAPALSQGDRTLTYADLNVQVSGLQDQLAKRGVHPGARVALMGNNTVEWVLGFLAAIGEGAIAVPLNSRLSPAELRRQLALCQPSVVLADEALLTKVERAEPPQRAAVMAFEDAGGPDSAARREGALPAADAPAIISFTSGTTGFPRGATLTHGALARSAHAYVERFDTGRDDRTTVLVPLFHNTGFVDQLAQMLLVGGNVDLLPRFGVGAALDALEARPATYLIAVPSIVRMLMLHERADVAFGGCRVMAYGGSSMPVAWIDELGESWPHLRLFNVYGLTEFTSVTHILVPEDVRRRPDSVGRPVRDVAQRVVDAEGRPVAVGETGEIEVAGPMRMAGYWCDDDATAATLRGDWLRTGDLGSIDAHGYLVVHGRSADVINRGGEKIHAAQVEAALSRVAEVVEAAAVGAPDPILQESVVAFVVARAGGAFDENAAREELAEWVPDYAIPQRFVVLDELPRNAAGKVDRGALRATVAGSPSAEAR